MYRSQTELEEDRWMTDDEALDRIQLVDGCDRETARDQLEKLKRDLPVIVRMIHAKSGLGALTMPSRVAVPRQVLRREIERLWPLPQPLATGTGAPGRPSSMHLIVREFQRRKEAGETCSKLAAEARALREWFVHEHPDAEAPSVHTIENRLRELYWSRRPSKSAPKSRDSK
jgi:hypothetical protein